MSRKDRKPRNTANTNIQNDVFESQSSSFSIRSGLKKSIKIIPKNEHQEEYLDYLLDDKKLVVIASGPAGSGKTMMAMMAGIKALMEKKVDKLILTRPVVNVEGELNLGALPGDLMEKMDPYIRPLYDVLIEHFNSKEITRMFEEQIIEISPMAFMRGRNFKKCWVILDESQNATKNQIKMILTRLCEGSKIVITGDNKQSDRHDYENGLLDFTKLLKIYGHSKYISTVEFEHIDIQRHPVVAEVLSIYGEE